MSNSNLEATGIQVVPAAFGDIEMSGVSGGDSSGNSDLLVVGVVMGFFLLLSSCYTMYFCYRTDGKDDIDDDNEDVSIFKDSDDLSDKIPDDKKKNTRLAKHQRRMTHIMTNNQGKMIGEKDFIVDDIHNPNPSPLGVDYL